MSLLQNDTTAEEVLKLAEAAYRTNLKKTYSPVEEAKICQQLFALNPDDYKVAETMHEKPERVKKIRQGYTLAKKIGGDETDQLTIGHFLYIADFENDDNAIEMLMNSSEANVERTYQRLCREREISVNLDELEANLSDLGIEIVTEVPAGYCYRGYAEEVADLEDDDLDPGMWVAKKRGWTTSQNVTAPKLASQNTRYILSGNIERKHDPYDGNYLHIPVKEVKNTDG